MTSTLPADLKSFDDAERARIEDRLRHLDRRALWVPAPRAAVLVPLCHKDGQPAVLFTKRSDTVGTHKGQVSFPGGRMDKEDRDDVACALREAHEEVGIKDVHVLGRFHDVMSITAMRVTPVVGYIGEVGDLSSLEVSRAEIDFAFALTLEQLCDPAHRSLQSLGLRKAPVFTAGPARVWGLTALILDDVLRQALALELPELE